MTRQVIVNVKKDGVVRIVGRNYVPTSVQVMGTVIGRQGNVSVKKVSGFYQTVPSKNV